MTGHEWKTVITLDKHRNIISGNTADLASAIGRGADLRIYTEFRHNEHIDIHSDNNELIKEVTDFRITYLLEKSWVAGIINLRQPVSLPGGFGPRPSMSFFLYNQNGEQAIARPYLDGQVSTGKRGPASVEPHEMPLYHQFDAWDTGTNAPSSNFAYDFDIYRFCISDNWTEVYSHNEEGVKISGSIELLEEKFSMGCEVKVGINGLCDDLDMPGAAIIPHEVFIHCGSCYYYSESKQFSAASQPVVRVKAGVPLRYKSEEWDFGWLIPRSDGLVSRWLVDPYTLKFKRSHEHHAIRWFVR